MILSLVSAAVALVTVVAAAVPPINIPGRPGVDPDSPPPFPAPAGYLLPWAGGEIHSLTQGEETTFTHNGLAAYAFDFDLSYDTIVAARAGEVRLVYDGSNSGGCSALFSNATNYVVIDHGDGTSALYLHIAHASATVKPGDRVHQGQPIAISGETGFTCSSIDSGPGPHLHFQVQRSSEDRYFTQSVPIAFDDIPRDEGVPQEGKSYVSGNYGPGKPQKIGLTPYRVPRIFNPVAVPADPTIIEAVPEVVPTPAPEPGDAAGESGPGDAAVIDTPAASETPSETETPRPTRTPTPSDTPTATHTPSPTPSATDTPSPTVEPPPTTPPDVSPATSSTEPPVASSFSPEPSETPPP
jgi:murein DD-endopeptidase MepM/ murein hydrolase activator NlpD